MRISDWSSDVCSSDLGWRRGVLRVAGWPTLVYDRPPGLPCDAEVACHWQLAPEAVVARRAARQVTADLGGVSAYLCASEGVAAMDCASGSPSPGAGWLSRRYRSEEHTSELQSLMRISYAVFCLKKKTKTN